MGRNAQEGMDHVVAPRHLDAYNSSLSTSSLVLLASSTVQVLSTGTVLIVAYPEIFNEKTSSFD
jgi:hypothetical protein